MNVFLFDNGIWIIIYYNKSSFDTNGRTNLTHRGIGDDDDDNYYSYYEHFEL